METQGFVLVSSRSWTLVGVGVDPAVVDELLDVCWLESDVSADLAERDAALRYETTNESGRHTQTVGNLLNI